MGKLVLSPGSFGFACVQYDWPRWSQVHSGGTRGRRIHLGSLWFTPTRLGVVRVRVVSLMPAMGSLSSLVFAWVHWGVPRGR